MTSICDEPIFVVGHVKSGTTLVQSLLDGHPGLFVLPLELKFLQHANVPTLPPGNRARGGLPSHRTPYKQAELEPGRVLEEVLGNADPADFLAGRPMSRNLPLESWAFDRERFRRRIDRADRSSLRAAFVDLAEAFHDAHRAAAEEEDGDDRAGDDREDGTPASTRLVEKTPQQEEHARELTRWFPDARFVHVLRSPYAVVNSEARDKTVHRSRRHRIYRPLAKSLYFLERNRRYLDRYRMIRFEDVVLETESTMRELADFLELPFRPSMLRPTVAGRPWGGNSRTVDGEFDGVDPRPVDAFRDQIAPLDVALVNRYFGPALERHGYDRLPDPGWRKWLPVGLEPPNLYVGNRVLLYTSYL